MASMLLVNNIYRNNLYQENYRHVFAKRLSK
jgi:hypothetical protein